VIVEEGPTSAGNAAAIVDSKSQKDPRGGSIVPVIFASSGCCGWICAFLWLQDYHQGERLAAWFSALMNVIILAVMGAVATLLLVIALVVARRVAGRPRPVMAKAGVYLSWIGLAYGAIILLTQLPGPLMLLLN